MSTRCDICGRFRSWRDLIAFDAGDSHVPEIAFECKACTAPANLRQS